MAIIGAGFTGLTAAFRLAQGGYGVTLLEQDDAVGGLAGSFAVGPTRLDRFYHHWFMSDQYVLSLVDELGLGSRVVRRATSTGLYYAKARYRLSSPLDLLRFDALGFFDRLRLGRMVLRARSLKDWERLESQTAREWVTSEAGRKVYEVLWEPLMRGKFGEYAEEVSAVWLWNKLKLRGGSRDAQGREALLYFRGGFAVVAEELAARVHRAGGQVLTSARVSGLSQRADGRWRVDHVGGSVCADAVIATVAPCIVAELLEGNVPAGYCASLRRIEYLANLCIVLEMKSALSDLYWTNVADVDFPFVGVIEHTNFEGAATYGGRHIVYMSKYLPVSDPLWHMEDGKLVGWVIPYLRRMFPRFDTSKLIEGHVWRARYAQPVVVRNYRKLIPATMSPLQGLYLSSMAQIYPEDRGTNYAVREGARVAELVMQRVSPSPGPNRAST